MLPGRAALVASALVCALTACTTTADDEPDADAPSATATTTATTSPSEQPAPPREAAELVVVGHASRPQLDLSSAQAERLVAGGLSRWRGFRVLVDLTPRRAIRAVEADPGMIAVVPLDAVGPTVVAARVAGVDPVRDAAEAIELTVAGDLMLVRGVPDAAAALRPLAARLRSADLTVANLESTLSTDGSPTQGDDSFGASPALVPVLRRAGFDAVSLANNHAGDYGPRALVDTIRTLRGSAVRPFGAGSDVAEASRAAVLSRGGVTFAFVGFNAIGETPRATRRQAGALSVRMPPRTGPLVSADLDRVADVVADLDRRADVVVVLPHWGTQYTHRPEPVQRRVARRLVAAGADLVVGGHPHWVQGVESVAGVPVVHSLGNFVFDMDFMEQTMEGVLLEATFWGAELKALRFVPYRMDEGSFAPRVVGGDVGRGVLGDLYSSSRGPWAP